MIDCGSFGVIAGFLIFFFLSHPPPRFARTRTNSQATVGPRPAGGVRVGY
jgi:hypothetical protein